MVVVKRYISNALDRLIYFDPPTLISYVEKNPMKKCAHHRVLESNKEKFTIQTRPNDEMKLLCVCTRHVNLILNELNRPIAPTVSLYHLALNSPN